MKQIEKLNALRGELTEAENTLAALEKETQEPWFVSIQVTRKSISDQIDALEKAKCVMREEVAKVLSNIPERFAHNWGEGVRDEYASLRLDPAFSDFSNYEFKCIIYGAYESSLYPAEQLIKEESEKLWDLQRACTPERWTELYTKYRNAQDKVGRLKNQITHLSDVKNFRTWARVNASYEQHKVREDYMQQRRLTARAHVDKLLKEKLDLAVASALLDLKQKLGWK